MCCTRPPAGIQICQKSVDRSIHDREAVDELVQVDRLVLLRAPEPLDKDGDRAVAVGSDDLRGHVRPRTVLAHRDPDTGRLQAPVNDRLVNLLPPDVQARAAAKGATFLRAV